MMLLSTLLSALPNVRTQIGEADPDITLITSDSRLVVPGALFVAIRGETVDGHRFIADAIQRDAVAIIAEDIPTPTHPHTIPYITVADTKSALAHLSAAWHGFPARKLVMIGVTGTDGKTTTSSLIHSILLAAGINAGLISTVSAVIGDESLDTGFHVTTPEAPEVQGYLARMLAAGLTHCVLEVTSHGLVQQRVAACEFDVAVATNVTHEHLDYHKTYANYLAAKGQLFEMLSESARKPGGPPKTGVLNADDRSYDYLDSVAKTRRLRYSLRRAADVWAEDIRHGPRGMAFTIKGAGYEIPASTTLVGDYNVSNILAAVTATVSTFGLSPDAARRGIAALRGVPGRMERIDLGQPFTAIVDFAHTPNALRRALETASQIARHPERSAVQDARRTVEGWIPVAGAPSTAPLRGSAQGAYGQGRIIAVFGSAGLRDVQKRRMMAEVSAQMADLTVLTAEDPRTESLDAILAMMAEGARAKGGIEGQTFFRVPDRGAAIRFAVGLARPGDLVIVCGKGHEQSMCFGTVEFPWDDRFAMRAALADLLRVPGPEMPHLPTGASRP